MDSILEVSDLCKEYGTKTALDHFSISLGKGEIVALIGKNGAGKTTLFNAICGYITSQSGKILYKKNDLKENKQYLREFGILMEPSFFPYLSAEGNLQLLLKASGKKDKVENTRIIKQLLEAVGLYDSRKKKVKSFSFGMKQRLGLCQCLLTPVGILLLDEPFVGLDPLGKEIFKEVIMKKAHDEGIPVIFSSHDLDDVAQICDRVVMIDNGKKVMDEQWKQEEEYVIQIDCIIPPSLQEKLIETNPGLKFINEETLLISSNVEIKELQKELFNHDIFIKDMKLRRNQLQELFYQN